MQTHSVELSLPLKQDLCMQTASLSHTNSETVSRHCLEESKLAWHKIMSGYCVLILFGVFQ